MKIIFFLFVMFVNISAQEWYSSFLTQSTVEGFGIKITANDSMLFIGSEVDKDSSSNRFGSVCYYKLENNSWVFKQKLLPFKSEFNSSAGPEFGHSMVLRDSFLYVSAKMDLYERWWGSVYEYKYYNDKWNFVQKILPAFDGSMYFGESIALHKNILVVGSYYDRVSAEDTRKLGSAQVFKKNGDKWEFWKRLQYVDGEPRRFQGTPVAINDSLIYVNDFAGGPTGNGYLFIYRYNEDSVYLEKTIIGNLSFETFKLHNDLLSILSRSIIYLYANEDNNWTLYDSVDLDLRKDYINIYSYEFFADSLVIGTSWDRIIVLKQNNVNYRYEVVDTIQGKSESAFGDEIVLHSNSIIIGAPGEDKVYIYKKNPMSVSDKEGVLINEYTLNQNYPNPFNPNTKISFTLPEHGVISLKVYNTLGEVVKTIINEYREAGKYEVDFNAKDLSSGLYIYQLNSNNKTLSRKMILLK